jgi:lysophospholipase L1-like esterase
MKKNTKNIVLTLATLVVLFALGETAARLAGPKPNQPTKDNVRLLVDDREAKRTVSSVGPKTKPRILFLGDSVTVGQGVPKDQVFSSLMDNLSREAGDDFEIVNAAISGAGTTMELSLLQTEGVKIAPDVVILCFNLNNVRGSPVGKRIKLPPWLGVSRLASLGARVLERRLAVMDRSMMKELEVWRAEFKKNNVISEGDPNTNLEAFNGLVYDAFLDWGCAWSPRTWDVLRPLFERFKELAFRHGFKPLVFCFPTKPQITAKFSVDYPQRMLGSTCSALGLPFIDLLPLLKEKALEAGGADKILRDECHLTPLGHVYVAAAIHDQLVQTLYTDDGRGPQGASIFNKVLVSKMRFKAVQDKSIIADKAAAEAAVEMRTAADDLHRTLLHARIDDLSALKDALEVYKADHGSYPKSSGGFDGLFSNWGESTKDWISALAPKYIVKLPRDPRYDNDGAHQYLYNSNGDDFKLIDHHPEDCDELAALRPAMIDPVRGCGAIGYWTKGATGW